MWSSDDALGIAITFSLETHQFNATWASVFASQSGHLGQYSTGILLFNVVYAMREWCVRNYSYFVFSAVAQEVYFYASVYEAVTYLVRDYAISGHRSLRLSEFGGGEVAHSNKSYFACIHQDTRLPECLLVHWMR